jgi:hypothetical protein
VRGERQVEHLDELPSGTVQLCLTGDPDEDSIAPTRNPHGTFEYHLAGRHVDVHNVQRPDWLALGAVQRIGCGTVGQVGD